MFQIKFTKKEIAEILKTEFPNELKKIQTNAMKYKMFFRSGAEYKSIKQLIGYLSQHEGNYFTLDCEIKNELKSLII